MYGESTILRLYQFKISTISICKVIACDLGGGVG